MINNIMPELGASNMIVGEATSGIGKALSEEIVKKSLNLVLVARGMQEGVDHLIEKTKPYENGAKGLGRYKTLEQVMGDNGIKARAIFEFPSSETIKEMIAGEEFNSLNELRKKAYKQVDLMICSSL